MNDCLFCSIANGEKTNLVWHNDVAAAFNDIHPKSPVHVLIVPKRHVVNLDDLDDPELAADMIMAIRTVADQLGVTGAYRLQVNNGKAAGQIVGHLHFHLRAGESKSPIDSL